MWIAGVGSELLLGARSDVDEDDLAPIGSPIDLEHSRVRLATGRHAEPRLAERGGRR